MTGAEPPWDPVPALTDGGGLKLGNPVGGVDGVWCIGWGADCACGALNPPLDGLEPWLEVKPPYCDPYPDGCCGDCCGLGADCCAPG